MKLADPNAEQKETGPIWACCGKPMRQPVTQEKANGRGLETIMKIVKCDCPVPQDTLSETNSGRDPQYRSAEALEGILAELKAIRSRLDPTPEDPKLKVAKHA
jgi:hypothetical protein